MKRNIYLAVVFGAYCLFTGCESDDPAAPPAPVPMSEYTIYSSEYLNHRFFHLDLPEQEFPNGRFQGDKIKEQSVKIFRLMPGGQPITGDITDVAAYIDYGYQIWDTIDFTQPHVIGRTWREITNTSWDPYYDANGELIAVDLRTSMRESDVLAVVYDVQKADGTVVQVGDFPGEDEPTQTMENQDGVYYRMKLLKAPVSDQEEFTFQYVLRNIYPLRGANIDETTFDLRIERSQTVNQPQVDENGIDYIRIFGLDRGNPQGFGNPDGIVDKWDILLIDLQKGLLKFPLDFPMPFAPGGTEEDADEIARIAYSAYADTSLFDWEKSEFLRTNQTPGLYDPRIYPSQYPEMAKFRIIATYAEAQ